jgi:hypothetical protein
MKVDLEPNESVSECPMCGSSASLHLTGIGANDKIKKGEIIATDTLYWVRCDDTDSAIDCGTTQPAVSDRANALARWNRRAE